MRKIFLLIPAMLLSLAMNAAVINITPGTSLAYTVSDAQPGDVIVLADGLYPGEDQIHLTKDITIKAADGAKPVVWTTYYCDFKSGAKVNIEGITFDGSTTSQQCIRVYDATAGKELRLNKCEFKNYPKDVIACDKADYTMDSCIINNCYFHNNNYSPIYFNKSSVEGKQTIYGLIVKNSTFANNNPASEYRSVIDVQSYNREATDDIEVVVDHCTFYNNTVKNYDYSAIRTRIVNRTIVSNCIFMHPAAQDWYATNVWAGSVINCLAYNFNNGYNAPTKTNANTGNPLFTDAANGDFTFANNWVTMNISPACGAATDGTDLGDPRWYTDPVVPSSNFVAPYAFVGEKAVISGNIWYNSTDDYLYYNDKSVCGTAKWKIHATRACAVKATLNMTTGSTSGHIFRVELLDANGNHVTEVAEPAQSSHDGDIDLPNPLAIPAEGDYTVILHNDQSWSSAKINSLTFAYVGGALVTIPAEELVGEEAVLVNDGSLKVSKLDNGDLKYGDNGSPLTEYVYWNINTTKYGRMDVTLNVVAPTSGSASGHKFLVELYSDLSGEPIASSSEPSQTSATGAISMPAINIPATGNYIIKLTNQTQWSSAILHSIAFAYAGGEVANVPGQILGVDAMLLKEDGGTLKMYINNDGDIQYNDNGYNMTEYALWNINATEAAEMIVTLNVAHSGHIFSMELYQGNTRLDSIGEADATKWDDGDIALASHLNFPAAGAYTLKLLNNQQYSGGALHGITFTKYIAPAAITLGENDEDNSAWADKVGGAAVNVTVGRSFLANMYNTVCVPFAADLSKVKALFGDDVELLKMSGATIEGEVLNLQFTAAEDIYQGTPFLIKPSAEVANPVFEGVQLLADEASSTSGTDADFMGIFIKTQLNANTDLFVGQGNQVHFPSSTSAPLKGLRAYFRIKAQAGAVKRARIVANEQVITEIDLVNGENSGLIKTLENGQLIINLDGIRYNVMGTQIR